MASDDDLDQYRDAETAPEAAEAVPELYFGSVDEFVRDHLRYIYTRPVGSFNKAAHWSARWWESAEAISRLESLWRAWEHLRLDPATGMSSWWRDHADHHMAVLLGPNGPFVKSEDKNAEDGSLPYESPPPGLFPDMR